MSKALAASETQIARPLNVLIPLIQQDLQSGRDAAASAALPWYRAAGEKLLEAQSQLAHGEFQDWITRHCHVKYAQARHYMLLAKSKSSLQSTFASLSDFIRQTSDPNYNKPHTVRPPAWHEPVKEIVGRVDTETLNLKRDELKRAEERDAQRALARQLIDIGYKVLARTLHPDKGGSREAMARLNAVRARLNGCI